MPTTGHLGIKIWTFIYNHKVINVIAMPHNWPMILLRDFIFKHQLSIN